MEQEHIIFQPEDVANNKVYGVLSYFGILFIIPLFVAKDSPYAKFHCNQGLLLFIMKLVLNAVGRALSFALNLGTLGLLHGMVSNFVAAIVGLISLVFVIIGIVNACSGEAKTLPIIGGITLIK